MRLAVLTLAATALTCFLGLNEPEPVEVSSWLDATAATSSPRLSQPRLSSMYATSIREDTLRIQDPDLLFEALLEAFLVQRRPKVRWILARLRAAGPRMNATLIRQLPRGRDLPAGTLRHSLARLLLYEAGPTAAPDLLNAVNEAALPVSAAAAITLYECTRDATACLPALIRYLDAPRDWARDDGGAALRTLDAMGADARDAVPILTGLLAVRTRVRLHGARIKELDGPRRVSVGYYARRLLADLGEEAGGAARDLERALLTAARRPNRFSVLYEVGINVRTLAALGREGRAILVRHMDHEDGVVRRLAAGALLETKEGIGDLIDATSDRYPQRRLVALCALASRNRDGDERVVGAIIGRLRDESVRIRTRAARALAMTGVWYEAHRPAVLRALVAGLYAKDETTRVAVLGALRDLGRPTPQLGRTVASILPTLGPLGLPIAVRIIGLSGARDETTALALESAALGRTKTER